MNPYIPVANNRFLSPAFLRGWGSIFGIAGNYFDVSFPGQTDAEAIAGDWEAIGQDLRSTFQEKLPLSSLLFSNMASEEEFKGGNKLQQDAKPTVPATILNELQPLLEDMPEAQAKAVKAIFIGLSINQHTSKSPLPSPAILKEYSKIIPDGAERILAMAEQQSAHRMVSVNREQDQSGRGQLLGFVLALFFLAASVVLIMVGHSVSGTVLGSIDLVALVSVFVFGKAMPRKELVINS